MLDLQTAKQGLVTNWVPAETEPLPIFLSGDDDRIRLLRSLSEQVMADIGEHGAIENPV